MKFQYLIKAIVLKLKFEQFLHNTSRDISLKNGKLQHKINNSI